MSCGGDHHGDDLEVAVRGMCEGDEAAFRQVYRTLHAPLLRYLSVLVGPDDADDVGSEAWAQAFRDLDRFTGDADGFRGWLTTIGRNRALDHLRRTERGRTVSLTEQDWLDRADDTDVEATVLALDGTERALAAIRSLPRDQAEAIMLRTALGLTAADAAAVLGKRPGAVRVATHRGLKTLSRRLGAGEIVLGVTLSGLLALKR
ncbi:MAG: RNA polymerase sigma factor [Nocardioides sp.]